MLFNSLDFAVFLPVVFMLYWLTANSAFKLQNLLVVVASYIFYGWWDWRFLSLIIISTGIDYFVGIKLGQEASQNKRKLLLWVSLLANLGILGSFKYYNFFIDNLATAFTLFGVQLNVSMLNIILPVGISFYTFQTMSYSIDVYNRKLNPTTDYIAFSAFVSFFPQLVAGPIERATHLLPQFYHVRVFDYSKAIDGLRQMLWGLFKKIVIADNSAYYANMVFNNSADYSGSSLVLGALFFAFQIYCDFSGYSDIAIGVSRLFGFDLMRNFNFPYFSRDIAEFWRRWHISLSTWFRDYLYFPLGGSHGGTWMKIRNTFVIFIVSGFWHGANWTFIAWGALNAVYFLPLLLTKSNRNHIEIVAKGRSIPTINEVLQILTTFSLTLLAWIFFRAESIGHAVEYISNIFTISIFAIPRGGFGYGALATFIFIIAFVVVEWHGRDEEYAIATIFMKWRRPYRLAAYYLIVFAIFWFGGAEQQFIYFQF